MGTALCLPSLVRGLLTTYCLTSSSLARLKSLRILLALLGPRRRGTVLSVSPGMSFSPEGNQTRRRWVNQDDYGQVHFIKLLGTCINHKQIKSLRTKKSRAQTKTQLPATAEWQETVHFLENLATLNRISSHSARLSLRGNWKCWKKNKKFSASS